MNMTMRLCLWAALLLLLIGAVAYGEAERFPAAAAFVEGAAEPTVQAEGADPFAMEAPPPQDVKWTAEELLATMSLRQKVGQLFVIKPQQLSGARITVTLDTRAAYEKYPVGGFALFSDNIESEAQLRKYLSDLRGLSHIVPILSVDEEGGRVARLANKSALGIENVGNMAAIGKTGDPQKAYEAGATIGAYLADYGFTMDFAPVADVRSNPNNAVIGNRSFGSDPQMVSQMVSAYIDGLHEHGIMSCIKHFPGHGDTKGDTHAGYVRLEKTADELMRTELVPFIGNLGKTDVVMVAHISLPRLSSDGLPASLSKRIITDGLRNGLGFTGVVITDSLQMGAITDDYKSDEAAVRALEAGADILLMPSSLSTAFEGVVRAVESGRVSQARLDESVLRILRLKLGA